MKGVNKYYICVIAITLSISSCKKIAKEASEQVLEKTTKSFSKEVTEEGIEVISKKQLKTITWNDFYEAIAKKMPSLANALKKLDNGTQKVLAKVISKDYRFLRALTKSQSVLDECTIYSKNASKLMKDPNFIRMYVKSDLLRNQGKHCILDDLLAIEERGYVNFYSKTSNKLIATYRDGIVNVFDKRFMSQELIPNAYYTLKGANGKKCSFVIDDLGRISSVEGKNMSPDEIATEIISNAGKSDYGKTWDVALKKLKQSSGKDDINIKCQFSYANDEEIIPKYAHIETDIKGKNKISSTYENVVKRAGNAFSAEENSALLKKYASKLKLSEAKSNKLLSEMNSDEGLALLIHENPEFNIKRWLKTRNHVDQKAITPTAKGRIPINSRTYAGNVYYFNPHLNSGLKARLKKGNGYADLRGMSKLSYDDLIKLDKMYPDGVPFTKQGYPDFSKVAAKGKDGKPIIVDIGTLSGNSNNDRIKAETIFQNNGNKASAGFTWHHIENSTLLLRVPREIHQLVDHSGGMSTSGLK